MLSTQTLREIFIDGFSPKLQSNLQQLLVEYQKELNAPQGAFPSDRFENLWSETEHELQRLARGKEPVL